MSLWTKAQQLQGEALRQVQAVYGEHFPIEVRHFLAPWIESKIMSDVDPDNPQHEQYAASVVGALIQELESKAQALTNEEFFLTKIKLQGAAEMFRQRYSQNPLGLLRIIRHCLGTELKLVQQAENMSLGMSSNPAALLPDASGEILQQLDILRQRTQETSEDLRRMEQEQEAFALEYHELTKIQANLTHLQNQAPSQQRNDFEKQLRIKKEMSEHKLNVKLAELLQMRMALAEKHKETLMLIENLQARVLDDELIRWKREQQLAGNGVPFHSNLDSIQEWCEGLAEIIWLNRQQIKEAERLRAKFPIMQANNTDHVPALNTQITQLLSSLVTSTFIIERQPPQVMKTNTRFTAMVRLLVGGKLNVHMTPPQVTVSIISEQQANTLLKNDKMAKGEASGEILNNTGTMEYQKASRQLSVSFRNMQLRKIKRAEKKGTESVMDEKFSLLFQSKFSVGGGELVFQVWTLSLPVVVIVHGNQEPHAWATVTWDNAFAEPGRTPFVVPEKVPWSQVAETLSTKFRSATGRALTESNQRFLASKAFRNPNLQLPLVGPEAGNLMLTWSQFCKEPLPERNFTFWEWFYALMKLTREHLRAPWMDNTIVGFIGRKQTEDLLKQCLRGTFMLRFSDSELGGVTIAWVGDSSEVFMLQPFTSKDFAIRTLADRVSDLKHLIYLYPDIPKDQAFGKYYTPFTDSQTPTNGYVKPLLVTHVPGWSSGGGNLETGSYPPTPQGFYNPQSPEASMGRDTPSVHSATSETVHSSFYPSTQTGQPNEVSDSFQDFMSQVDFFALFGIPLNGILFATLGNYFGSKLVKRPNKRKRGRVATFILITAEILLYSIPGLIVFLAFPAGLFTIVEGWDYVDSFYYAFVTLTTIGFGDLVAGQHDIGQWTWVYRSFIIIWILFGLGYLIMVINIITKGLRSNPVVAPVIALEKRMAARIRATRHLLAKDGVALRQLVHDIRVMKAKPVPRQARMELLRTFSHPVLRYEKPHIEKDPEKLNEATGSDGLNNAGIHYIDRGITCNNGSFRKPMERMESIEDPLQLLTRLATVLCNDDQENDLSIPEISISEVEHSQENRDICKESAFDRIRRSLRLSRNRSGEEPPCPPFSSNVQRGSQTGNVNRIRTDRRVRHVSESHSQTITDCSGSMKSHRQLIIEQERKPASEFRRSRSEKFAPNKGASISSLSDSPSLDWSHQSKKDLLVGAIYNTDNAARTGSPTIAAVKLCDMLDRVQISRQSSRASPKN